MANQKQCAVVIPIYKIPLSNFEKIAFEQCLKVLKDFTIVIIKPTDLNLPDYLSENTSSISFKNDYFKGIHGYNSLMLSEEFYAQFLNFNYILIHQLDAFVFSNKLDFWCSKNYDYIGAPWLRERQFKSKYKYYKEELKSFYHRRYNVIEKNGMPALDKQMANQVGNGGLSLRKTKAFHEICITQKEKIKYYLEKQNAYFNEDIFFSIEINRKKKLLKIPKYQEAIDFAFETQLEKALTLNHNQLPFGCHAWEKHLDFWRPYFEDVGYTI
ncbi:DUF5672 family protein [Pedobacter mucosus]|uniref:DUF5672 family protein n=1 Tax=Pedobacter mucosus TaxID=2895286 RepID=UPI001EE40859|nr:DUF5672 family protein [Pedobacter mucosus]UKT63815.1 hypothetical protein LOK61_18845 [Pedobacter mucosus]